MASKSEHPFVSHPSRPRLETCRLCLAEVQAKKEVIESSVELPKRKEERMKRCDKQLENLYWELSKKDIGRQRHLCYCRHAEPQLKAEARRNRGLEPPEPGQPKVKLPDFNKKRSSLPDEPRAPTKAASSGTLATTEAGPSPKRKRASRSAVGKVQSYREPSEDEGLLNDEAQSRPATKKTKVRAEKQDPSDSSDSDLDGPKDYSDFFAPSTSSSSRSRSRSTTGTPLSAHQFASNFSGLTTTASPVPTIPPVIPTVPRPTPVAAASPAPNLPLRSQSLPTDREEALLLDRIEHFVCATLHEYKLPEAEESDGYRDAEAESPQKQRKAATSKPKPNLPLMVYKVQQALDTLKAMAEEGGTSLDIAKAKAFGKQHLQTRLEELQTAQGIKQLPVKTTPTGNDAMWERLEREVEMDAKLAKKMARAARGYSPSRPYCEDSDDEIQAL